MAGAERKQIYRAYPQYQALPDNRDLYPSHEGRPHLFHIVGPQRLAEHAVVEPVLSGKSQQERDKAEA
jgi:hypothetical protein